MKPAHALLLFSVCVSSVALAFAPRSLFAAPSTVTATFTAVSADPAGEVFAGMKKSKGGLEVTSGLLQIHSKTMKISVLKLPPALHDRELRVILSDLDRVFVLSQWVVEQGDAPLFHVYDRKSRKWTEIGRVECPQIQSVTAKPEGLEFSCQETNVKDGTDLTTTKSLASPRWKVPAQGRIEIPQAQAGATDATAALDGDSFSALGLKVKARGREKLFLARDIRF